MANEKFRKEHKDHVGMPTYARFMTVLAVVLLAFSTAMHIMESMTPMLLMVIGVVALVLAILAAFGWDAMGALRKVVRICFIAIPLIVVGIAIAVAVYSSSLNPEATPWFNLLVSLSVGLHLVQALFVYFMPMLVVAASFGAKFDRILLNVVALLNAAILPFFVYVSADEVGMPLFTYEEPIVQLVYIASAVVFALLTFVPAIAGDPEHCIKSKPARSAKKAPDGE